MRRIELLRHGVCFGRDEPADQPFRSSPYGLLRDRSQKRGFNRPADDSAAHEERIDLAHRVPVVAYGHTDQTSVAELIPQSYRVDPPVSTPRQLSYFLFAVAPGRDIKLVRLLG